MSASNVLRRAESYEALRAGFAWDLPQRLNMAHQVCDRWMVSDPDRTAIIDLTSGASRPVSYRALWHLSRRIEAGLIAHGLLAGDRVGVFLPQSPYCAAAHIAAWRLGIITVPLFRLFGEAALSVRLEDAGAGLVITDTHGVGRLAGLPVATLLEAALPDPELASAAGALTGPDDPAVLIYTSGTTGPPKGALHAHRVLTGHLPGVALSHDFLGQPGDRLWTPADWAWIGGLFDVLMPGLALGVPVVASPPERFDPENCARIVHDTAARNLFLPATALRLLRADGVVIDGLRSVASGGEPLGAELRDWGEDALGLVINEFYGQTECNMIVSSCAAQFDPRPCHMGRAVPGFDVDVIDEGGGAAEGEGDLAVRRGAPSMFLGYWNQPDATAAKFRGDWMLTGDRGVRNGADLRFLGREDDVICSAGYRIGPGEIEDCLLAHPSVAAAGVVGKPDPERGEIVKAYVVLRHDRAVDPVVLRDWVRDRLSAHLSPREITVLETLPTTLTGKVMRRDLRARARSEVGSEP